MKKIHLSSVLGCLLSLCIVVFSNQPLLSQSEIDSVGIELNVDESFNVDSVEEADSVKSLPEENGAQFKIQAISGTYALIVGSYSTMSNAKRAINSLKEKYPRLADQVGIINVDNKFRVGILNLKTKRDTQSYKANLVKDYRAFRDAWPYKVVISD